SPRSQPPRARREAELATEAEPPGARAPRRQAEVAPALKPGAASQVRARARQPGPSSRSPGEAEPQARTGRRQLKPRPRPEPANEAAADWSPPTRLPPIGARQRGCRRLEPANEAAADWSPPPRLRQPPGRAVQPAENRADEPRPPQAPKARARALTSRTQPPARTHPRGAAPPPD